MRTHPRNRARAQVRTDAYRDDLAYIHDAGFGNFARAAASVLVEILRRNGIRSGHVTDLGCGSGILSERMAGAGYDVLGIDISEAMVKMARERVPEGDFRVESLLTAKPPQSVAIVAVGECINYVFDAGNNHVSQARLFRRVYDALTSGGYFIFDFAEPGRVPGKGVSRNYFEGDDWTVLVTAREDRRHRRLTREITTYRRVGELFRRDHEVHGQRLLERTEVAAQLRGLGFRVRILRGYGTLRFVRGHVGLCARKP
jgi:SAM-dependent methyltransferase